MKKSTAVSLFFLFVSAYGLGVEKPAEGGARSLDDLGIRLVGTVFFQGDSSALIEIEPTGEQRFLNLDDEYEGFAVGDILPDQIRFTRDGGDFALALRRQSEPLAIQILKAAKTKVAPSLDFSATKTSSTPTSRHRLEMPYLNNPKSGAFGFLAPLMGQLRSGFGYRRDPLGGGNSFHSGVDIASSMGTPIRAAAEGVVVFSGYNSRLGYHVEIKHPSDFTTVYGHMMKNIAVQEGQAVKAGAIVGYEGSSGRSTGPHLHFEVRKKGIAVDPRIYAPSLSR
ncbi:MAG: M23 family metallopeptidase [Candidatus Sumerlaeota bacterium]|nr:M23 family metallopeptidase [Candidatus Sumerlaeota bacterium]